MVWSSTLVSIDVQYSDFSLLWLWVLYDVNPQLILACDSLITYLERVSKWHLSRLSEATLTFSLSFGLCSFFSKFSWMWVTTPSVHAAPTPLCGKVHRAAEVMGHVSNVQEKSDKFESKTYRCSQVHLQVWAAFEGIKKRRKAIQKKKKKQEGREAKKKPRKAEQTVK